MIKRANRKSADTAYTVILYIICVYAGFATIINVLNMMEIQFFPWLMKPTFWGSSLLIMLLLLYELIHPARKNEIIKKIMPYVMGILIADIVSACRFQLCLVLLLVLGYFLVSGFQKRYNAQEAALTAITACVGIEIYSILYLLLENGSTNSVSSFLQSVGPDVLFVLSAVLYSTVTNTSPRETDAEPGTMPKLRRFANNKIIKRLKAVYKWFIANPIKIAHYAGYGLCIISIALFFYYALTVGAGIRKVRVSPESLYVLEHCEDPTLALTAVKTEDPTVYTVSFEKYEGKGTQKIYFKIIGENRYHLLFHEPQCTLEIMEDGGLYATSGEDPSSQEWISEVYKDDISVVRLLATPETTLRYNLLDSGEAQFVVSADNNGVQNEFFIMERTIGDSFATRMISRYSDEFIPTTLMGTLLTFFGEWFWLFFIMLAVSIALITYSRRFIGDKYAALTIVLLLYVLNYESMRTIALFYMAFGIRWYYCYRIHVLRKKGVYGG